mgnify:CR=1 FL=1
MQLYKKKAEQEEKGGKIFFQFECFIIITIMELFEYLGHVHLTLRNVLDTF